jgi:RNA polymerase sigma factor (sigma-70 family)
MKKELNKDYYLWKSFKEGSEDSFYKLYDEYSDVLYRFGMHFSKDKEFIKDCIHDLFLDLYKYRDKLSLTYNIQFYLARSLRRKIHQAQIKPIPLIYESAIISLADNHVLTFEDTIIASESEDENNRLLRKALKKLTDRQREGLSLKFEQNLTYPEIAEILEMSVESARTSIYRALKILRKSIQNDKSSIQLLFFLSRQLML